MKYRHSMSSDPKNCIPVHNISYNTIIDTKYVIYCVPHYTCIVLRYISNILLVETVLDMLVFTFQTGFIFLNFRFQRNERAPWNYCKKQNRFTSNRKQCSTGNKSSGGVSEAAVLPTRAHHRMT